MVNENLLKLTSALRRVADIFPEKEPLKICVKKKSLEIFADVALYQSVYSPIRQKSKICARILQNIEILENYLMLAEAQNWIKKENFSLLIVKYSEIKQEIAESLKADSEKLAKKPKNKSLNKGSENSEKREIGDLINNLKKPRHKKIFQIIQKRGSTQVKDLEASLPGVTKRTLRRDMGYLMALGIIERNGDKSATAYKAKIGEYGL